MRPVTHSPAWSAIVRDSEGIGHGVNTPTAHGSTRFARVFALTLVVVLAVTDIPEIFAATIIAPVKNWALPLFTNEGPRSMTARGSEARFVTANHIEVVDLNLTVFSGDATSKVESILLSPAATFLPQDKIAQGDKSVRFIGQGMEASGSRWLYRHGEKKISLDGNVRVIFDAELKNLLQ